MNPGNICLVVRGPETPFRIKLQKLILTNSWQTQTSVGQAGDDKLWFSLLLAGPEMIRMVPSTAILAFLEYARGDPKATCQLYLGENGMPINSFTAGMLIEAFAGQRTLPGWVMTLQMPLIVVWGILCVTAAREREIAQTCVSNGELPPPEGDE